MESSLLLALSYSREKEGESKWERGRERERRDYLLWCNVEELGGGVSESQ